MANVEDLAKAREIVRKHCGANIRATGPTVTDDDWEPGYAGLRDTIAQALAEARTTPKPADEVVEALELSNAWMQWHLHTGKHEAEKYELAIKLAKEAGWMPPTDGDPFNEFNWSMQKFVAEQARAALAAQSAREKP